MTIKWTKDDVVQWLAMYADGLSLEEISHRTGAKVPTIQYRLNKAGVRLRGSRGPLGNAKGRFDRKWTPEPNTGCWLWVSGTDAAGYGFFKHEGELTAHRASYRLHKGAIPTGMHVLHVCDVPQCVNPDHLFLGDQVANMKDCARKGRTQRYNASKTHCPKGHPYAGSNVYWIPSGGRSCRACARDFMNNKRRLHGDKMRADERRRYWAKKERSNA